MQNLQLIIFLLLSCSAIQGQEENTLSDKPIVDTLNTQAPIDSLSQDLSVTDSAKPNFKQELASSLLWKIDHDSIETTSYLFGTMHLPDSRVIALFDSIGNNIDLCDAVAVELILKPSDAFSMMPAMVMKDSTLKDFYTKEEFSRVDEVIKNELGLMGLFVNRMKPVFLSTTIQQMRFGGDISYVVDQYIQDEGKRLGKEIIGIETMDEQMNALTGMSLQLQADMLLEYVDEIEKNDSLTNVLVNSYLNQSLGGLFDIYSEDELPEEMNDNLVIIRNIKMAKRVEKMLRKQSTFVAVGALHLPGETGLINMLREAGFTVEPAQKE